MRKCLLILLLFYTASFAAAQNKMLDSLQTILSKQTEDASKVNTLNELSYEFRVRESNPQRGMHYARQALALAQKLGYRKGEGTAYLNIGRAFQGLKNPAEALKNCQVALQIFLAAKDEPNIAKGFLNIGRLYHIEAKYAEALKYYTTALKRHQGIKDTAGMVETYKWLAMVYEEQNNSPETLKHLYSGLRLAEQSGDKPYVALLRQIIGVTYFRQGNPEDALENYAVAAKTYEQLDDKTEMARTSNTMAFIYAQQGKYEEALSRTKAAFKVFSAAGKPGDIAFAYSSIGSVYEKKGDAAVATQDTAAAEKSYTEARINYNAALMYREKLTCESCAAFDYVSLGGINIKLRRFAEAKGYLQKGLQLAASMRTNMALLREAYLNFSKVDSAEGNYRQAYEHHKKYIAYRDSIVNEEGAKKLTQLKMQFDFDKREELAKAEELKKEAERQRTRNRQYLVMAALIVVVLVVVLVAYQQWRYNRQEKKANGLLQQKNEQIQEALHELRATQTQLVQKEKMASLGELTAGIAHEIQNPLNFVNNFSEANKDLLDELEEEARNGNVQGVAAIVKDIRTNEEKISHHGRRADNIVKSMLQHSRASAGQKETTNINQLVEEHLRLSYHGFRSKDPAFTAIVETHFSEMAGSIAVVPQDIGRVLLNLFNNAFYAVSEKKRQLNGTFKPLVSVTTKKEGDHIAITVKDNGTGMSQKVREKVFQPFFTTKPTGEGTGLGLSLSYDIITKGHSGELKVESKEGAGAEFVVKLPLSKPLS